MLNRLQADPPAGSLALVLRISINVLTVPHEGLTPGGVFLFIFERYTAVTSWCWHSTAAFSVDPDGRGSLRVSERARRRANLASHHDGLGPDPMYGHLDANAAR